MMDVHWIGRWALAWGSECPKADSGRTRFLKVLGR